MKFLFKRNMGTLDRTLRASIGIFLLALFIQGTIGTIFMIISMALLITGISGYCPGYVPFGISTKRESKGESPWRIELNVQHHFECRESRLSGG
jgi:hypothetical protein